MPIHDDIKAMTQMWTDTVIRMRIGCGKAMLRVDPSNGSASVSECSQRKEIELFKVESAPAYAGYVAFRVQGTNRYLTLHFGCHEAEVEL